MDDELTSLFTGSPSQWMTVSGATMQYGVGSVSMTLNSTALIPPRTRNMSPEKITKNNLLVTVCQIKKQTTTKCFPIMHQACNKFLCILTVIIKDVRGAIVRKSLTIKLSTKHALNIIYNAMNTCHTTMQESGAVDHVKMHYKNNKGTERCKQKVFLHG